MKFFKLKNILFLTLPLLMVACGNENNIKDLKEYVADKKHFIKENKKNKPKIQINRMEKVALNLDERSPFEILSKVSPQKKSFNPLTFYSLNELDFVGTIEHDNEFKAVIVTPKGLSYEVKIGDEIGDHYGKVIKIGKDFLEVKILYAQDSGKMLEKVIKLNIKD